MVPQPEVQTLLLINLLIIITFACRTLLLVEQLELKTPNEEQIVIKYKKVE
jgi:hypothetical protein